jgi:4-amino-4-deoxy-L-arabinose transferase-like glycosyltransferase
MERNALGIGWQRTTTDAPATARSDAWRWPLAIAALVFGAIFLRLPYLDVPISADEGGYATTAYWWARGNTLYREITITRPQGIFVVFRAIDALGLGSARGIHIFAAVWVALSTVALLAVAARLWGRGIGLAAAALYAAMMALPWVEGYQANAELFMTLPLLLGIGALLHADEYPPDAQRWRLLLVASGVLGAIALLLKPSAIALLPFGALWLSRRWFVVAGGSRRGWLAATGWFALGWALGLAPALLHGLASAPDRYLSAVLLYRVGQDSLIGGAVAHQLNYFATNTLFIIGHLPLLLFAPFGFRLAAHGGDRRARAFLALWALTALGGVALGGNWFLHYYQQLLPPLAIALALIARWLIRRPLIPPRFAIACCASLAIPTLVLPLAGGFISGVNPRALPGWEPGVSAAAPIASYLAAHTTPADTIYVAYDHADIYYLSGRRPAARWLHFRELARTPGAFDEQVARLGNPATAPRYIVGAQAFDRWGFDPDGALRALVARDYQHETTIGGIALYRYKGN